MSQELKEILGRLWSKTERKYFAEENTAKPFLEGVYWLSDRLESEESASQIIRGLRSARELDVNAFDAVFNKYRRIPGSPGIFCQFENWLEYGIVMSGSSDGRRVLALKGTQGTNLCIAESGRTKGIYKPLRQLALPLKTRDTAKNTDLAILNAEVRYKKDWSTILPGDKQQMESVYTSAISRATDALRVIIDRL